MKLIEAIGEPALLELVAEECAELAHAALKLARVERKENPTPCTPEECKEKVMEEWADAITTMLELLEADWIDEKNIARYRQYKLARMEERISSRTK